MTYELAAEGLQWTRVITVMGKLLPQRRSLRTMPLATQGSEPSDPRISFCVKASLVRSPRARVPVGPAMTNLKIAPCESASVHVLHEGYVGRAGGDDERVAGAVRLSSTGTRREFTTTGDLRGGTGRSIVTPTGRTSIRPSGCCARPAIPPWTSPPSRPRAVTRSRARTPRRQTPPVGDPLGSDAGAAHRP